jgi:hypothetical protein
MGKTKSVFCLAMMTLALLSVTCTSFLNEVTGGPSGPVRITIANKSSLDITRTYYHAFGSNLWDTVSNARIPAGSFLGVTLPGSGIIIGYLMATNTAGDSAIIYDRQFSSARNDTVIFTDTTFAGPTRFIVKNTSSSTIDTLDYRTSGNTNWVTASPNPLPAGDSITIYLIYSNAGNFDVHAVNAAGTAVRSSIYVSPLNPPVLTFTDVDFK